MTAYISNYLDSSCEHRSFSNRMAEQLKNSQRIDGSETLEPCLDIHPYVKEDYIAASATFLKMFVNTMSFSIIRLIIEMNK